MKPYREPTDRRTQARAESGMNNLLWIFVGSLITVMIGVFLYLSPLFDGIRNDVDVNPPMEVKPLPQEPVEKDGYKFYDILPERDFKGSGSGLGENPQDAPSQTPSAQEPTTKTVDVIVTAPRDKNSNNITVVEENETYDDTTAPADETAGKVDEATEEAINANISIKAGKTYILQVRSYDNAEEADRKRDEVVMAGVDARVVRRLDASGAELFQVISSPMSSRAVAIDAEQRLSANGIDAIIVEQRH